MRCRNIGCNSSCCRNSANIENTKMPTGADTADDFTGDQPQSRQFHPTQVHEFMLHQFSNAEVLFLAKAKEVRLTSIVKIQQNAGPRTFHRHVL